MLIGLWPLLQFKNPPSGRALASTCRAACVGSWLLLGALSFFSPAAMARAADPLADLKTITVVPRTESEIVAAHERNKGFPCEHIPANEPLELTEFVLWESAPGISGRGRLPIPMVRRPVFTVGLEMLSEDRSSLPTLSKGKILEYLGGHYVAVEARVLKDLADGTLYLNDRAMAATVNFSGPRLTQEFTEMVSQSVQDMRSLGLLVKHGERRTPERLRTLVMVHKSMLALTDVKKPKATYELAVIHGRDTGGKKGTLTLHSFGTSHNRTQLHYFFPFVAPSRPEQCSIRAAIYFTDYTLANLLPTASVARRTTVRSKATFSMSRLDAYVIEQGWSGSAFDNLVPILNAIIDHKLVEDTAE